MGLSGSIDASCNVIVMGVVRKQLLRPRREIFRMSILEKKKKKFFFNLCGYLNLVIPCLETLHMQHKSGLDNKGESLYPTSGDFQFCWYP